MQCILCNNNTKKIHHESFNINFYYCNHCEFLFKDPAHYISQTEEKKIYDTHENDIHDITYIKYFEKFITPALLPYVKKGAQGLDYGSGPKPVLSHLLENKYGFEMDIYDLFYHNKPIPKPSYDFITCTEVIEHVNNPSQVFETFHGRLKKEGILSIMTLFHLKDDEYFRNWHYMRDMSHISFFTKKTMNYLAKKHHFEIIYCDDKRYTTFRKL